MNNGCVEKLDDGNDLYGVDDTADLPVSKKKVADFKAQQAKLAAERPLLRVAGRPAGRGGCRHNLFGHAWP